MNDFRAVEIHTVNVGEVELAVLPELGGTTTAVSKACRYVFHPSNRGFAELPEGPNDCAFVALPGTSSIFRRQEIVSATIAAGSRLDCAMVY